MASKAKKAPKTETKTVEGMRITAVGASPRVWMAVRLRCQGYRYTEARDLLMKVHEIKQRQAEMDVEAAQELIAQGLSGSVKQEAEEGIEFLKEVRMRAMLAGEFGDAVRAQGEINKMLGNHAAAKVSVELPDPAVRTKSADRQKRIAELLAKAAGR